EVLALLESVPRPGPGRGQRVRLCGIADVPLTWVSQGPLGHAARAAIKSSTDADKAGQSFATELTSSAMMADQAQIRASLDGSLIRTLRGIRSRGPAADSDSP